MEEKKRTLAEAQKQVDSITAKKAELTARRETLSRRIGSTQTESARRYLAGDAGGLEETARLRSEIDVITSSLELLEADLRQAELEELNARTAKVLAELSQLEDVKYSHSILSSMPAPGAWLEWGTVTPPKKWMGIPEMQLAIPGLDQKVEVPLSRRLRVQIQDLERQADRIEHQLRQSRPAPAAA